MHVLGMPRCWRLYLYSTVFHVCFSKKKMNSSRLREHIPHAFAAYAVPLVQFEQASGIVGKAVRTDPCVQVLWVLAAADML